MGSKTMKKTMRIGKQALILFDFQSFYDPTQWRHIDKRRTFIDEDPIIDYFYFLH